VFLAFVVKFRLLDFLYLYLNLSFKLHVLIQIKRSPDGDLYHSCHLTLSSPHYETNGIDSNSVGVILIPTKAIGEIHFGRFYPVSPTIPRYTKEYDRWMWSCKGLPPLSNSLSNSSLVE